MKQRRKPLPEILMKYSALLLTEAALLQCGRQNYFCSQLWLPTVQLVLHADWQDVWHSPQPPFFRDS